MAEALEQFARHVGATQLVLGVDPHRALPPVPAEHEPGGGAGGGRMDVHLVPVPAVTGPAVSSANAVVLSPRRRMLGWLAAMVLPGFATVIGVAAGDLIGPTSAALVFMLAVVGVALIGGLGAAVLSAVTATVLLNYFFTPRCTASPWSSPNTCSR